MQINLEDFKKVELSVGEILSVEKVPETDKLLKLTVDFGVRHITTPLSPPLKGGEAEQNTPPQILPTEAVHLSHPKTGAQGLATLPNLVSHPSEEGRRQEREIRQIISGIALYFLDIQTLVGKKCMFVTNLEPRAIRGLESNGMILALSTEDGKFSLLEPNATIPVGTKAK